MSFSTLPVLFAKATPSAVAFSFGSTQVYWYGILLALGIIAVILMTNGETKRLHLPRDTAVDLCLIAIPCGVVGARLLYVIANYPLYQASPVTMLHIWDGGLSIYGAVLLALIGILVYITVKKLPFFTVMDALAPGLLIGQAIALWGDFFNQQGYGPMLTARSMTWFPFAVRIDQTHAIHCAVFFYEFIWCIAAFCFIWFFVRKKAKHSGTVFLTYLALFALGHGCFEALRVNSACISGTDIKIASAACAILLLAAVILLVMRHRQPADAEILASLPTDTEEACLVVDEAPASEEIFEQSCADTDGADGPEAAHSEGQKEQSEEKKENDSADQSTKE